MGFSRWLRSNSEHYLLIDAQRRIGTRYNSRLPTNPRGLRERFWRNVFTPVYRLLPWGVRKRVISAMPGSHRRDWPRASGRPPGPAV